MIARTVAQILLATSFLQFFPTDVGTVEPYANLPESAPRQSVGVAEAISILYRPLPASEDADWSPVKVHETSLGVWTSAVSALVVDAKSGDVLFSKNPDSTRSVGSITKLMTALVFLDGKSDLGKPAQIEPSDVRSGGTLHLPTGEMVTVGDLLQASLVGSDNSATMSLVRLTGMSEGDFVARMNEKAAEIGMLDTTFSDPTGLSAENRSTAPDIVALLRGSLSNETIRKATELSSIQIVAASGRTYFIESTNDLLNSYLQQPPYRILGGKTGFLPEAGYCLGVQVSKDSAQDIYVVVLGSDTKEGRFRDVKALAGWTYQTFEWPPARTTVQSDDDTTVASL